MEDRIGLSAAAKILGVSTQRVDQIVRAGLLPIHDETPLGRLFLRSDVEALAEKRQAAK